MAFSTNRKRGRQLRCMVYVSVHILEHGEVTWMKPLVDICALKSFCKSHLQRLLQVWRSLKILVVSGRSLRLTDLSRLSSILVRSMRPSNSRFWSWLLQPFFPARSCAGWSRKPWTSSGIAQLSCGENKISCSKQKLLLRVPENDPQLHSLSGLVNNCIDYLKSRIKSWDQVHNKGGSPVRFAFQNWKNIWNFDDIGTWLGEVCKQVFQIPCFVRENGFDVLK